MCVLGRSGTKAEGGGATAHSKLRAPAAAGLSRLAARPHGRARPVMAGFRQFSAIGGAVGARRAASISAKKVPKML